MPLEPNFDNIDDLVSANPALDDEVNEGDNHIRGVKNALQGNVSGSDLRTALLQQGIEALGVDDKGAQVVGQVTVSDPAPLNPDELTRKDFVDAQTGIAGVGLVPGNEPVFDVNPGNGLQIFGDEVTMSGSFTGTLDVSQQVKAGLFPAAVDDLTRKDYVDNNDAVLQGQLDEIIGSSAQRRIQVEDVQTIGGTQAPVGQAITVVFAVPFIAVPTVTLTVLNPANQNNGFAYLNTISTTGFTATTGVSGTTVHWAAIGSAA